MNQPEQVPDLAARLGVCDPPPGTPETLTAAATGHWPQEGRTVNEDAGLKGRAVSESARILDPIHTGAL